MNYTIYRLEFFNGVRFGSGSLDSTEFSFHADMLFSALYQEALKLDKEKVFLEAMEQNKLVFSDGFPYMGKEYFIPKPMLRIVSRDSETRGNSREKKLIKNMKYIPVELLDKFLEGNFPISQMNQLHDLGKKGMKVSVGIRGNENPEPYRVNAFYFNDGNGLYVIVGYLEKSARIIFEELLESLSYTGIGGKKSAGLGRFEYQECKIPVKLENFLQNSGKVKLLLSTALPLDEELEEVLDEANYSLLKRGGFIDSERYAEQQMRKQERYVFAPGSCFRKSFTGTIRVEKNGGTHPILRYEKALFLGVDV